MKRIHIIFIVIAGGILLIGAFYSLGWYPLFFANGHMVSARESTLREHVAIAAYQKLSNSSAISEKERMTFRGALLTEMIEGILIHDELLRSMDAATLQYLLDEKLKNANANATFVAGAEHLYGVPFQQVKEFVLTPQAERDILTSHLFLKGKSIDDWLRDAKNNAHVIIFNTGFSWKDGGVTQR